MKTKAEIKLVSAFCSCPHIVMHYFQKNACLLLSIATILTAQTIHHFIKKLSQICQIEFKLLLYYCNISSCVITFIAKFAFSFS